jgi:hypothetical protein
VTLRQVQDRDDGVRGLFPLAIANPARCVECDSGVGGEQPIGPDATRPIETTRLEIGRVKHDGVFVGFGLAGNLAKYDVVAAQGRKNQCGTPLRLGQVGEWKMQDYDVPSYKSAQAASSSGESQSFLREDSASRAGAAASAFPHLREWMKPSRASRSFSGTLSNSRAMISFLLIRFPRLHVTGSIAAAVQPPASWWAKSVWQFRSVP